MSAIPTYLKVEHIRLETGEVLVLDGVIYVIESVEKLIYSEVHDLTGLQRGRTFVIANLRPEDDEIYQVEHFGFSHEFYDANLVRQVFPSGALVRLAYPRGDPRFTPHGLSIELDENMASRLDPIRVDFWVKPATEPALIVDNTLNQPICFKSWWYGWKYRTKVITKGDMEASLARGVRVLTIERYVSK